MAEWQTCLPAGRRNRLKIYDILCLLLEKWARNYIYVGLTNNFERRFHQHQAGKERTTAPYTPLKTILLEKYPTRIEARKREKYLKSGVGKEFLKRIHKI